jgi:hypothetical protein
MGPRLNVARTLCYGPICIGFFWGVIVLQGPTLMILEFSSYLAVEEYEVVLWGLSCEVHTIFKFPEFIPIST